VVVTLIQPAAIDTQFLDHSRTYLGVTPSHPSPVYDARVVANAIVECCQAPHRNLRVGGAAKMFTSMEKMAPGLDDRMKERTVFDQSMSDRPKEPGDDTLWRPRSGNVRRERQLPQGEAAEHVHHRSAAPDGDVLWRGGAGFGHRDGAHAARRLSAD
jgi:hypothetical protein